MPRKGRLTPGKVKMGDFLDKLTGAGREEPRKGRAGEGKRERTKVTVYLPPDVNLLVDRIKVEWQAREGRRVERSEVVEEAIRRLAREEGFLS